MIRDVVRNVVGGVVKFSGGNILPFKSDLAFHAKTRSGLTLIDEFGGNDASILPATITTIKNGNNGCRCNSGIIPQANTVWAVKCRFTVAEANHQHGMFQSTSVCYAFSSNASKFTLWWGNQIALPSSINLDTDWHVFILYDKKLWVCPVTTELTDSSILNVINTVTPSISGNPAGVWGTSTARLSYGAYGEAATNHGAFEYSESKIGTITSNVITWQAHDIFCNNNYTYDVLNATSKIWSISASDPYLPLNSFSVNGYKDLLNSGYDCYYLYGTGKIYIPKLESGARFTNPTVPNGYVKILELDGNLTKHNLANSVIEFQNDVFDRSNATIYSDLARSATTKYNANYPKRWHVEELDRYNLNTWLNTDYKGIWFPNISPNSIEIDEKLLLKEVFVYNANKMGEDFNKIVRYTHDYNLLTI